MDGGAPTLVRRGEARIAEVLAALPPRVQLALSASRQAGGPQPLLVFLHGGGWVIGDLITHDEPCRLLCRNAGVHVLAVDYRLAPEAAYPAAVDDALAAFRWAHAN